MSLAPKLPKEIIDYPVEFVAFCPDCLTVKNKSSKLPLNTIMDIDADTAKHECSECKTGIVSELLLDKEVMDDMVKILIELPDNQVPPAFYSDELLYSGKTGYDFVVTIDNFLDDTFGAKRSNATIEIAVDESSGLPMMIFEHKDTIAGTTESESGLLSIIGLVRLFRENPAVYVKLGDVAKRVVDMVGEFLLTYEIDARTRLLY